MPVVLELANYMLALPEDRFALKCGGSHKKEPFPESKGSLVLLGCYRKGRADCVGRILRFPMKRHSMDNAGRAIQPRGAARDSYRNTVGR